MKPNQSLEIQLADSVGRPVNVANVVVEIRFFTRGTQRYSFALGRTDEGGHLSAPYSEIERIRRDNAEDSLMDYNTKLEDCDSDVKLVIPSQPQLVEQYDRALRNYGQPPGWANVWPSNVKITAEEKSVRLINSVTEAQVPVSWSKDAG